MTTRVPLSSLDSFRLTPAGERHVLEAVRRDARVRNVRARFALLKDRVRDMNRAQLEAIKPPAPKGYTWRGWWYPRALVLGIAWSIAGALFGVMVWLLFTTPALA